MIWAPLQGKYVIGLRFGCVLTAVTLLNNEALINAPLLPDRTLLRPIPYRTLKPIETRI